MPLGLQALHNLMMILYAHVDAVKMYANQHADSWLIDVIQNRYTCLHAQQRKRKGVVQQYHQYRRVAGM